MEVYKIVNSLCFAKQGLEDLLNTQFTDKDTYEYQYESKLKELFNNLSRLNISKLERNNTYAPIINVMVTQLLSIIDTEQKDNPILHRIINIFDRYLDSCKKMSILRENPTCHRFELNMNTFTNVSTTYQDGICYPLIHYSASYFQLSMTCKYLYNVCITYTNMIKYDYISLLKSAIHNKCENCITSFVDNHPAHGTRLSIQDKYKRIPMLKDFVKYHFVHNIPIMGVCDKLIDYTTVKNLWISEDVSEFIKIIITHRNIDKSLIKYLFQIINKFGNEEFKNIPNLSDLIEYACVNVKDNKLFEEIMNFNGHYHDNQHFSHTIFLCDPVDKIKYVIKHNRDLLALYYDPDMIILGIIDGIWGFTEPEMMYIIKYLKNDELLIFIVRINQKCIDNLRTLRTLLIKLMYERLLQNDGLLLCDIMVYKQEHVNNQLCNILRSESVENGRTIVLNNNFSLVPLYETFEILNYYVEDDLIVGKIIKDVMILFPGIELI